MISNKYSIQNRNILIALCLISGCWSNLISGLGVSLSIYSNAIKTTFDLVQKDVELLSSMFSLGAGLAVFPGYSLDYFGAGVTNMIGVALYAVATLMLTVTIYVNDSYFSSQKGSILVFYFFLAGLGTSYTYTSTVVVNSLNFSDKHKPWVQSLLNIFYAGSPLFYAPVYKKWHDITLLLGGPQNLSGSYYLWSFSLFLAVFGTLSGIANVFLCKFVPPDEGQGVEIAPVLSVLPSLKISHKKFNLIADLRSYFCKRMYLFPLLVYVLQQGINSVIISNSTTMSQSLGLSMYDFVYIIIIPTCVGILSNVIIGILSLKLQFAGSQYFLWTISSCFFFVSLLLLVAIELSSTNGLGWLMLTLCSSQISLAGGIFFVVIIAENYYPNVVGQMVGWGILLASLLTLFLQWLFGVMYDSMIDLSKTHTCLSNKCFRYSLILDVFLAAISVGFSIALTGQQMCTSSIEMQEPETNETLLESSED